MKTSEYEEETSKMQEIIRWLKKKGIPLGRYENLQIHYKTVLRNLLCEPTRPTTDNQRRELYRKLCLQDIAGRESMDPVDFMPGEELIKFFKPLTPSERLNYYEKF